MNEKIKSVCQQIIQIFEVDTPDGGYDNVTLIPGDSGGLTYGKHQTTLNSGNLYLLIRNYCERIKNYHGASNLLITNIEYLESCLPRLKNLDQSLNHDQKFISALKFVSVSDPLMIEVQDEFFDRRYWTPAIKLFLTLELTYPLSLAVVYDSCVHGAFGRVRRLFPEVPPNKGGDEKRWVVAYINARRKWFITNQLDGKPYKADDNCVYRMNSFNKLIQEGNWNLETPFWVRGHKII
jgi:chitosanase